MEITQRRELDLHLCTLRYDELVPWQKKVVDMCNTVPHPRKVYWVVDEEGGRGKSVLCKCGCTTLTKRRFHPPLPADLMENYTAFVSGEEARCPPWPGLAKLL